MKHDLLDRMAGRVQKDRTESDTALFNALMYWGEMITKYVVSSLLAGVLDDREKHRRRLVGRLVRADGIGDWEAALGDILTGPASQHLCPDIRAEQQALTEKVAAGSWQFDSVSCIHECLKSLDAYRESLPNKLPGQKWFSLFTILRNKTRGHGAPLPSKLESVCPLLEDSLQLLSDNLPLFKRPVAYLHRNLSGAYRITPIAGNSSCFGSAVASVQASVQDGVYLFANGAYRIELLFSDADCSDFFFPNGGFTEKRFSVISYLSGIVRDEDSASYRGIATHLPSSETEGLGNLEQQGMSFGNIPTLPRGYVVREDLESELQDLLLEDRHPIVTLHGRGGIGKTWLALQVLDRVAKTGRFDVVIWFSSRDIDLLQAGPKLVKPKVTTHHDIAKDFVQLLSPSEAASRDFSPEEYLSRHLSGTPLGRPILFVFDNFETVRSPGDLYSWLDDQIRSPNKILITTRTREFRGDYPVEIPGMTKLESCELVSQVSKRLGIGRWMNKEKIDRLIEESMGHPYVIRIMLGEVAKRRRSEKLEQIFAGKEDILEALFDRTFLKLSPAACRVFLTLCNWRSSVPRLALEAVLLRHSNDRMDVHEAIRELELYSFVEIAPGPEGEESELVGVPLIAAVFGKRKLKVSELKSIVQNDSELLQGFGPIQSSYARTGVAASIDSMFRNVARKIGNDRGKLLEYRAMLDLICRRYPPAWLRFSELLEDLGDNADAIEAVKKYIEVSDEDAGLRGAWGRLERLCQKAQDWSGEIQAIAERCKLPGTSFEAVSGSASRINKGLKEHFSEFQVEQKSAILEDMVNLMEDRIDEASATDLSRLAWLHLNLKNRERALEVARRGLEIDTTNHYCEKLVERLTLFCDPE